MNAFGPGPIAVLGEDAPPNDWAPWGSAIEPGRPAGAPAPDIGGLWLHRAAPTAAFSRRDTLLPGYPAARAACERRGFTPFVRPVGGRMAPYHFETVLLDLAAPHPDPKAGIRERFTTFADAIAAGLRSLGVDARVGEVPDEYCPGEFSVNTGGRRKLAGVAQRVNRWGYVVSALVVVGDPEPLRAVTSEVYRALDIRLDPATIGAVSDDLPDIAWSEVAAAIRPELIGRIPT
jgi:octanoyl-[GcvH]:protein N-octanoyltransferase